MSKTVVVISTGGTIFSRASSASETTNYALSDTSVEDEFKDVPLPEGIKIRSCKLMNVASSRISAEHWRDLIGAVEESLKDEEVLGCVVTHGTDTMEESAFLSDLLIHSEKPVVFTGSMRPASATSADGPMNFAQAVAAAADPASKGRGTLIVMNSKILEARFARKTHTTDVETFRADPYGIAGIVNGLSVLYARGTPRNKAPFSSEIISDGELPFVPIVFGYATEDGRMVQAAVESGAKGIVYAGVGHGSTSEGAEKALAKACEQGVVVVRASRTNGPVHVRKPLWEELGFISSGAFCAVKARLLLSLAVKHYRGDREKIKELFYRGI